MNSQSPPYVMFFHTHLMFERLYELDKKSRYSSQHYLGLIPLLPPNDLDKWLPSPASFPALRSHQSDQEPY